MIKVGQLAQFKPRDYFSLDTVWLTPIENLNKDAELLGSQVLTGTRIFCPKDEIDNQVAEFLGSSAAVYVWWFPFKSSYAIMPTSWFKEL
jgi:hypothetical protein